MKHLCDPLSKSRSQMKSSACSKRKQLQLATGSKVWAVRGLLRRLSHPSNCPEQGTAGSWHCPPAWPPPVPPNQGNAALPEPALVTAHGTAGGPARAAPVAVPMEFPVAEHKGSRITWDRAESLCNDTKGFCPCRITDIFPHEFHIRFFKLTDSQLGDSFGDTKDLTESCSYSAWTYSGENKSAVRSNLA